MSRPVLALLCAVCTLATASPASAYWRSTGSGTGTGTTATMPTGATPTTTASGRSVTVTWTQNSFGSGTVGSAGGGYTVTRYAEGSSTAITPATACTGTITGTTSTLSCVEANVPYGRWQYRITPVLNSFTGTAGPLSTVLALTLAAPVLNAVTPQNPASGATNGPIAVAWSAVTDATGYNVYRRITGGSYDFNTPLNASPTTGTTYSDTTGTNSSSYDYVVRAVLSGTATATSANSNERTGKVITRPAAPAGAVTAASGNGGAINVSWTAVSGVAGYDVYRRTSTGSYDYNAPLNGATPVTTTTYKDATGSPSISYRYVIHAIIIGASSAQVESVDSAESTAASCSSNYGVTAYNSGPSDGFRLDETSGTTANNVINSSRNGVYVGGVTLGQAGAVNCDSNPAATFDGSTGYVGAAAATAAIAGPNTFTTEIWFKTTTGGGKLIGFGAARTGTSGNNDRHIYLTNDGRVVFGVYPNTVKTVVSPGSYIDGAWHMAAASLGAAGMRLYVDGAEVGSDPTVTNGEAYNGYWRIGFDNLNGWPNSPSNWYFNGALDEVGIFGSQLSAATIASHYAANKP